MAEILPPLRSNITQGCYAITRRAARRESALLRTPVWQQCWFDSCKDDMCKHLARHWKQSYPSIIATLRPGSFSFIQRDYDALVPILRNHFLFLSMALYKSIYGMIWYDIADGLYSRRFSKWSRLTSSGVKPPVSCRSSIGQGKFVVKDQCFTTMPRCHCGCVGLANFVHM